MPQFPSASAFVLGAVFLGGCVVSFDGYELSTDASTGGSVGGGSGGLGALGGSVNGGSSGGGSGGSGGTGATGGVSGSGNGGNGGTPTGGNGGSAGSGGNGGMTGGGTGGTGGSLPTCPNGGGAMVAVPTTTSGYHCVDVTEVTQAAYLAFLGTDPNSKPQITACNANNFQPPPPATCDGWSPTSTPDFPAVCVDWCDAYGFCKFYGKHLCGKFQAGGGSLPSGEANDASKDEWYNACSAGGVQLYPYGLSYLPTKCNGLNAGTIGPTDVTQFATCTGGYPGIYGLSGNVREWIDSCSGGNCMQRGGGWLDGASGLTCTSTPSQSSTLKNDEIGFRCCAEAT
jgi:hypothetical protein